MEQEDEHPPGIAVTQTEWELSEARAEIARHHRDFLRIQQELDHIEENPDAIMEHVRCIRNIVG